MPGTWRALTLPGLSEVPQTSVWVTVVASSTLLPSRARTLSSDRPGQEAPTLAEASEAKEMTPEWQGLVSQWAGTNLSSCHAALGGLPELSHCFTRCHCGHRGLGAGSL